MGNSLLNTKVNHTLRMNRWKSKEKDPFVTYTLVKKALTKTTYKSIANALSEYTDLKRKNFDSLGSYLRRLQALKERIVKHTKGIPDDSDLHLLIALKGLKEVYPQEYRF